MIHPKLLVRFFDEQNNQVKVNVPADVLAVEIPEQPEYCGQASWHLPALTITVSTDAIRMDKASGKSVSLFEYTDLLAEDISPAKPLRNKTPKQRLLLWISQEEKQAKALHREAEKARKDSDYTDIDALEQSAATQAVIETLAAVREQVKALLPD